MGTLKKSYKDYDLTKNNMAPFSSITAFHTVPSYIISSFVYYVDKCLKKSKDVFKYTSPFLSHQTDFINHESGYLLELMMPRFTPDDIQIELYEKTTGVNEIEVSGKLPSKSFHQHWTLPNDADETAINAHLEYGVLSITMPKKTPTKLVSHRIQIHN